MQNNRRPTPPRQSQPIVKVAKANLKTTRSPLGDWFGALPPHAQALIVGFGIGLVLLFGLLAMPAGQAFAGLLVFGLAFAAGIVMGTGR